ncbi:MAG TPA: SDR family oxidoreductase [Chitinophagaceae bacterium]
MKILITGANGFLGQHLCAHLMRGYDVVASGRDGKRLPFPELEYREADLCHRQAAAKLVAEIQPDVVIHTAAVSKPDECQQNPERCKLVNTEATGLLLAACLQMKKQPLFVYISSDFVLGDQGPHAEDAVPDPLNFYGLTKLRSEQLVHYSGLRTAIVRPVFMYGATWSGMRKGFLQWVKSSLESGTRIRVVDDQQRTPCFVGDVCKGIEAIVQQQATGIFHLAGPDRLSPFRMAVKLAELLQLDPGLLEPVTEESFPEPVRRAKQGGLLFTRAGNELGFNPVGVEAGLRLSLGLAAER